MTLPAVLAGCTTTGGVLSEDSLERSVSIASTADQPSIPIEYDLELTKTEITGDHTAVLEVSITNTGDETRYITPVDAATAEYVTSADGELTLLWPEVSETMTGPIPEDGCWKATDAQNELARGTMVLDPDQSRTSETYVYGSPDLPDGTCLPTGEHEFSVQADATTDPSSGSDPREYTWGFTLDVRA